MSHDDGTLAISKTGVRMQRFDDGALAIICTDGLGGDKRTAQAMHLRPDQAAALLGFARVLGSRDRGPDVLAEAAEAVGDDFEAAHGDAAGNLQAIAAMWSPIFASGGPVTPHKVALAMIAFKVARAIGMPARRKLWRDIAGYVRLAERAGFISPHD